MKLVMLNRTLTPKSTSRIIANTIQPRPRRGGRGEAAGKITGGEATGGGGGIEGGLAGGGAFWSIIREISSSPTTGQVRPWSRHRAAGSTGPGYVRWKWQNESSAFAR